jgi:hypothetical protein
MSHFGTRRSLLIPDATRNAERGNHSFFFNFKSDRRASFRFRLLPGHTFVDIMKIDVEGAEFDALTTFVDSHPNGDLPVGQLQLEIHADRNRADFDWFRGWWESLEAVGLRPFFLEPNLVHVTNPGCRKPFVVEVRFFFSVASFLFVFLAFF